MGAMFTALFNALTMLFSAFENGASALNHLAVWGNEAAGQFEDVARYDREEAKKKMLKAANLTDFPKAKAKEGIKGAATAVVE